jgi:hypothetical protein
MSDGPIPCPWCSAPLRVNNRALAGATTACPDCRAPIRIVDGGTQGLSIKRASAKAEKLPAVSQTSAVSPPPIDRVSARQSAAVLWRARARRVVGGVARGAAIFGRLKDPLVLCWSAAILFAVVMLFVLKPWGGTSSSSVDDSEIAARDAASGTGPDPAGAKLLPPEIDPASETAPVEPVRA